MRELLARYLQQLEVSRSSRTLRAQSRRVVGMLIDYLPARGLSLKVTEVSSAQLQEFVEWIASTPTKTGQLAAGHTQMRWRSSLRRFFHWLRETGVILENPATAIAVVRVAKAEAAALSEQDIKQLIEAPAVTRPWPKPRAVAIRDRAIMELLYATGIRLGEAAKLELYDIDLGAEEIKVREGKGGKSRIVPFTTQAREWLEIYLGEARPLLLKVSCNTTRLWISNLGRPISQQGIAIQIGKYAGQVKVKASPHTFRHSFATHLLSRGARIEEIQRLLGHDSLAGTEIYTHIKQADLKRIINNQEE